MTHRSHFARLLTIAAGLGLVAGAAAPAFAAKRGKPTTVTVPAAALKDATSKLCMPRTALPGKEDKALPQTLCLTQEEWSAKGLTIVVK
ncbi:MAG: hypothetical protein V4537_01535 [Pseudomonadota bacterium]